MRRAPAKLEPTLRLKAPTIRGAGRGKPLGVPTLNIDPIHAPEALTHGIYACWVILEDKRLQGALHFGPRPVFNDLTPSLEVYVLDAVLDEHPEHIELEIAARIRDIENFESPKALKAAIDEDVQSVRAILGA